jgi:hypothetical protein
MELERIDHAQNSELRPFVEERAIKARLFDKIEIERSKIRSPKNALSDTKENKLPSVKAIIDIVSINEKSEIVRIFKRYFWCIKL